MEKYGHETDFNSVKKVDVLHAFVSDFLNLFFTCLCT